MTTVSPLDIFRETVMKKWLLFLLLLTTLLGVIYTQTKNTNINYTFYHWKQKYAVPTDTNLLPSYIKLLDIAYNKKLEIKVTQFKTKPNKDIVPVIYIDNPVFLQEQAKPLAQKLLTLLEKTSTQNFTYKEVQFDCDWTPKTRANYFLFLKTFKTLSQKTLSSTIRLHQIKYHEKTGVPPVDYAVLMYYNMSNFKDIETKNYILDLEVAKAYHYNFESYPLQLNLALPLYAQATIQRFEEVVGAIEGIRKKDLNEHFKEIRKNHYQVIKTHYFKHRLLYKDDILRLDAVTIDDLSLAIQGLKKVMKKPKEIIFYRWGNHGFYKDKALKELCRW